MAHNRWDLTNFLNSIDRLPSFHTFVAIPKNVDSYCQAGLRTLDYEKISPSICVENHAC